MLTTEYERAVLTIAIVGDPRKLPVLGRLKATDFEAQWHRDLWRIVRSQHALGKRVDIIELTTAIQEKHPTCAGRLTEVLEARPEWANLDTYVGSIIQGAKERRLLASVELYAKGYREQPRQFRRLVSELKAEVAAIDEGRESESTEVVIERALSELADEARRSLQGKTAGIPTGYRCLDRATGGWSEGLIFVVSWSSGGKTAFMIPSIIAAAEAGHRFRIYSLDMPASRLLVRLASHRHEIPGGVVASRQFTPAHMDQIGETAAWLMAHGSICETSMTVDELCADAMAYRDTFDAVFIDTFQSFRWDSEDKRSSLYDRTCHAINRLKELKKVLRKPVIIAAQAKDPPDRREVAKGDVAPPTLNDAEGARRITQEASQMVIVWRTSYGQSSATGRAKIQLAKSQQGMTQAFDCQWDSNIGRFLEGRAPEPEVSSRYGDGE